jgi:hypothetical protein
MKEKDDIKNREEQRQGYMRCRLRRPSPSPVLPDAKSKIRSTKKARNSAEQVLLPLPPLMYYGR